MYEAKEVGSFSTRVEAQAAGRRLESEGIPYLIKSVLRPTPQDPDAIAAVIFVAPDIEARAREVLSTALQADAG